MMRYSIETLQRLNASEEIADIILEFYTVQTRRLHAAGGPQIAPERPVSGFWADASKYVPPRGALVLARAQAGHLIGCGGMTDIGQGVAELKYLYVRPEARGTGLGQRLVSERIDIARRMGLRQIYVDTLKVSVEMHGLYEKLGFGKVAEFPQSKSIRDLPELAPFMKFYTMNL